MYIYIYIYIYIYSMSCKRKCHYLEEHPHHWVGIKVSVVAVSLRDKDLYTTTNKCLQCLIKIMYTVF